jgi:hypothetical protein
MANDIAPTPILDPSQLYEKRKTKDIYRLKTYNKILDQIYHRILVTSRLPTSQCSILYQVPTFILGLPRIDLEDCITYLVYQLRHAKYDVRYTYPNLLYISWLHHEKSYIIEQSPIMQTMLQSYEKTQEEEASRLLYTKKSQRQVRAQTPGLGVPVAAIKNVLKPMRPPSLPVAQPPIASAAEYQPPSSFLQNIMNPPSNIPKQQSSVDYLR